MSSSLIAAVVGVLLVLGAFGAFRFTRWLARQNDRKVILIAAVTAWFTLFGMIPFFAFAILVGRSSSTAVPPVASFVLNLVPFALVAGPFVGFAQGMKLSRPLRSSNRGPA